jgi:hypothetical protein
MRLDDGAKFDHQVAQKLVEVGGARQVRSYDEIAAALGEHRAEPFARLEDPLDEHDVLCPNLYASRDEIGIDQPGLGREHWVGQDWLRVYLTGRAARGPAAG